jgi:hypothetical protein
MPDFKAFVFVALLICLYAVKLNFDGQCWIVFGHKMFWPDKFYQHCLGLIRYAQKRCHTFISTRRLAETAETAALQGKLGLKYTAV